MITQCIPIDQEKINGAFHCQIKASIFEGTIPFREEPSIVFAHGVYLNVEIRKVTHLSGFQLTRLEINLAGHKYSQMTDRPVTFVEWERI